MMRVFYSRMTVLFLLLVPVVIELIVSLYKRDGMYTVWGTVGNSVSAFIGRFIALRIVTLYLGLYSLWGITTLFDLRMAHDNLAGFLLCFVIVDLIYYIFHRIHHKVDFFWTFHHVHHGDHQFNLSTSLRVSWVEQIYQTLFFIPMLFFGFSPEAILTCYAWLVLYQFFCHGQYIQVPQWVEYVFVTPRFHRVHHDQEERHQASNYGGVFTFWDRLFNSYVADVPNFIPGIKGYKEDNPIRFQTDPIIAKLKKHFGKKTP
jgi:sterol desaturase/sphingolipid hydroxylase (fatty acid hydroxylase superfamily)